MTHLDTGVALRIALAVVALGIVVVIGLIAYYKGYADAQRDQETCIATATVVCP